MNKKLISKCCGDKVMENGGYRCIKCGKPCEVIEEPIQKEEAKEPELKVGSVILVEQAYENIRGEYIDEYAKVLSIDDNGFMKLEWPTKELNDFLKDCEYHINEYKDCVVHEILFKPETPTTSDTFIEEKIEELSNLGMDVVCDNKVIETILFKDALSIVNQVKIECFLKSSLQSQRQSILEEIEKLPKIQYGVYGSGDLLEDIKQLLK